MTYLRSIIGGLLSIEGRAIRPEYQGKGLGTLALSGILKVTNVPAAASVTRNPAVLRLMTTGFQIVSPDMGAGDPLHYFRNDERVQEATEVYGRHVVADPQSLPFVYDRYTGGLYGESDPGQNLTALPQVANNPENGVIMAAVERRYDV